MTITYRRHEVFGVDIPVLHRVVYDHTTEGVKAFYQRSYKDHLVDEWLKVYCRARYYHSPGWMTEKFIEFEDDEDAVLFALMWA